MRLSGLLVEAKGLCQLELFFDFIDFFLEPTDMIYREKSLLVETS
ncbi:MAG: hypothetical protein WCG48_01990 [Candidatus Berkelbacteria bacterium]